MTLFILGFRETTAHPWRYFTLRGGWSQDRMSARPYETRAAAMSYGIRCEKTGWFRVEQVRR